MFACPNGHPTPDGIRFCHRCGARIFPEAAEFGDVPRAPRTGGTNANTAIYVLAGLVVLLAMVAVLAVTLMGSGGESARPPRVEPSVRTESPTAGSRGPLPAEASPCTGTLPGNRPYGHIGDPAASSCAFIQNAARVYLANPGTGPYTVHSDATNRDYDNVVCGATKGWVVCQGGRADAQGKPSARMYFAQR